MINHEDMKKMVDDLFEKHGLESEILEDLEGWFHIKSLDNNIFILLETFDDAQFISFNSQRKNRKEIINVVGILDAIEKYIPGAVEKKFSIKLIDEDGDGLNYYELTSKFRF